MHDKIFLFSAALLLGTYSGANYALDIDNELIPRPVIEKFRHTYPDALDMHAETVTHFGVPLIKISFKKGAEQELEYYRPNGSKFVNGSLLMRMKSRWKYSKP